MSEPRKIYGGIDQSSIYDGVSLAGTGDPALAEISTQQAGARLDNVFEADGNAFLQAEQLSRNTGLSLASALENPGQAQRASFARQNAETLADSPLTTRFVNSNPQYAPVLKNPAALRDVSYFEGLANGLKRGGLGARMMFHQWRADKMRQFALDEGKSPFEIWQDMRTDGGTQEPQPLSAFDLLIGLERWASSRLNPDAYSDYLRHERQVGRYSRERQKRPYSRQTDDLMQSVMEQEDVLGKLAEVVLDPVGVTAFVSENLLEALPQLIPAVAVGALTRSPGAGLVALGYGSYSAERFNSTVEFLEASGVDFTSRSDVYNLFRNPELWQQAEQRGMRRGAVIAGIDMLSGGIAGRALAANPLGDLVLQLGVQTGMAASGEALAQKVSGQEFDLNQVIFEGIGELGTAPIEIYGIARPMFSRIKDMTDEARAEVTHRIFGDLARHLQKKQAGREAGELRAAHASEVLRNVGVQTVYIPAEALLRAKEALGAGWLAKLDMEKTQDLRGMARTGADVGISTRSFVRHVLENRDASNAILEHVRFRPEDLTYAEARRQKAQNESLNAMERARYQDALKKGFEDVEPPKNPESAELLADARHAIGLSSLMDDYEMGPDYVGKRLAARLSEEEAIQVQLAETEKKRIDSIYQKEIAEVTPEAKQAVRNMPVYRALAYLRKEKKKLSAEQAFNVLGLDTKDAQDALLKALPGNTFSRKGGLDIDDVADMFGFADSEALLKRMQNIPSFNDMVKILAQRKADQRFSLRKPYIQKLDDAIQAIYKTGKIPELILSELNKLRTRRGLKRVKHYMVKNQANMRLREMTMGEIDPARFQNEQSNAAIAAINAFQKELAGEPSDFRTAAEYKYIQAVNLELMGRAYEVNKKVGKFRELAKKYSRRRIEADKTSIEYVEAAQQILRVFGLSEGPVKPVDLRAWADRKFSEGVVLSLPGWVLDLSGEGRSYKNLSLLEFEQLFAALKTIEGQGRREKRLLAFHEKGKLGVIAEQVAKGVKRNFKKDTFGETRNVKRAKEEAAFVSMMQNFHQYAKKGDRFLGSILLSAETLLGKIDGWQSEGAAKTAIKTPIDRAFFEGFGYVTIDGKKQNRIGFLPRLEKELVRLNEVFSILPEQYYKKINKKNLIPGVHRKITNGERLALFLNLGAESNYAALLKGRNFSKAEMNILVETMTEEEFRFVGKAWEFLASFRDEVDATLRERDNRPLVDKVARAYETPHGMLEGGYYPLRYEAEEGLMYRSKNVEEAFKEMVQNSPLLAYTNDGHTIEEVGSADAAVELEIEILKFHMRQVVYDLEVGDAIRDSWKILNNKMVKDAFKTQKRTDVWTGLSTWLADTATGEIFRSHWFDRALRHVRVGTIVAKLAWRASIGAIQTAGVFQSAALVGKRNIVTGITDLLRFGGANTVSRAYDFVTSASEFMARREYMIDRDIELFYEKHSGSAHKALIDWGFVFIRKGQKFTDSITWLAAYRQGLQKFQGDYEKSIEHADNIVSQTQGTAVYHQRSAVERGTLSASMRNQEIVRGFTVFMGHFIRKLNILYQISSDYKNSPKTIMGSLDFISNVFFLVLAESLLIAYFSDGFEDDEDAGDVAGTALKEGLATLAAGVPVVRNVPFMLEYNITSSGSAGGSFVQDFTNLLEQIGQGKFDRGMQNALVDFVGVAAKLPAQQIKDTGGAMLDAAEGKEVKPLEFITGQ